MFINGLIEIGGHAGTNLVREFLLKGFTSRPPAVSTRIPEPAYPHRPEPAASSAPSRRLRRVFSVTAITVALYLTLLEFAVDSRIRTSKEGRG